MEKIKRSKPYETFLVEHFGRTRSAALYAGSLYHRAYYYENGTLVAEKMLFEQARTFFEPLAQQWINMEIEDENQINKLHEAFSGASIRGIV